MVYVPELKFEKTGFVVQLELSSEYSYGAVPDVTVAVISPSLAP